MKIRLGLLIVLTLCVPATAQEAKETLQVLGPTVGHVDTDHALLWLRADGVRTLKVRLAGKTRQVAVKQLGRGFATARVNSLKPNRRYELAVTIPGQAKPIALSFKTAPQPRAWGKVRFGVGSCAKWADQPVWDQVLEAKLDMFLFLGDNSYYWKRKGGGADWDSIESMVKKQVWSRTRGSLMQCMQRMANYATWDDHDYGPNNTDSRWKLRREARLVHRYMWANPGYGQNEEGVYFSFRRGPIEVFLLDGRFFKRVHREVPQAKRVLYGRKQLAWLKRGIENSTAPLKIVGCGVQQLLGYPLAEGWDQARTERKQFVSWLSKQGSRVLFLSGDIHISELYCVPLDKKTGYQAWELTASGLANGSRFSTAFKLLERDERKWCVVKPNFCVVEVDIPKAKKDLLKGTVTFQCISATGGVLQTTKTTLATFGVTKKAKAKK